MLSFVRNKNTKKISYVASGFFLLLVAVGISFPGVASAGWWSCVTDPLVCTVNGILYGIFVAIGAFVSIAVGIFEYAIDPSVYGPDGLFNKLSVYNMWKFIRDFFNLFFILTLLYTAFTIVFQIAGNYKKTLLSIVLAALFVNFSFPLTRVMIDAANVPMYYFANLIMSSSGGTGTSASSTLGPALSASGLKDILIPQETEITGMTMSQILMGIIFLFVFMVTLMVLSILFVVRMMALLVLVMFSSVGFAGSVIPGMKQYSDMWWDKLRQYALFGPAAMFMLYIATQLFNEISKDNTKQALNIATAANATTQSTSFLASAGMYSITIIMLWIAIGLANSMSIVGASAIAGRGQQFLKWVGKTTTVTPAKFVGRKIDSKILAPRGLSPTALLHAFKQRSEEQKHRDEQPIKQAAAKKQDQLNKIFSGATDNWYKPWKIPGAIKKGTGSDRTEHNFAQTQAQASEKEKEITAVSDSGDHVIHESKIALENKEIDKLNGALLSLAKTNDLNDWISAMGKEKKADGTNKYDLKRDEKGEAYVSSENARSLMATVFREAGEKDEELLAKRMMVISDRATASGNFAFGGMTKFDNGKFRLTEQRQRQKKNEDGSLAKDENGKPVMETYDEQAEWAAGKVKNLESQKRQTSIHPDSIFTRTAGGGFGDINGEVAKEIIKTFTSGDVAHVDRSRDDLKEAIHQAYSNKSAKFMEMYNDGENEIFKQYVDSVVRMKRGFKKDDIKSTTDNREWAAANAPGTKYTGAKPQTPGMSSGASGTPIIVEASAGSGPRPKTP